MYVPTEESVESKQVRVVPFLAYAQQSLHRAITDKTRTQQIR